jgi:hypothetical protein
LDKVILLVEDNPDDEALCLRAFKKSKAVRIIVDLGKLSEKNGTMRLLLAMIVTSSLALGGLVLMKVYAPRAQHKQPVCPATVSLVVAGRLRKMPFD